MILETRRVRWVLEQHSQTFGPYTTGELRRLVEAGRVARTALVHDLDSGAAGIPVARVREVAALPPKRGHDRRLARRVPVGGEVILISPEDLTSGSLVDVSASGILVELHDRTAPIRGPMRAVVRSPDLARSHLLHIRPVRRLDSLESTTIAFVITAETEAFLRAVSQVVRDFDFADALAEEFSGPYLEEARGAS